jgi:hypothetical protein
MILNLINDLYKISKTFISCKDYFRESGNLIYINSHVFRKTLNEFVIFHKNYKSVENEINN